MTLEYLGEAHETPNGPDEGGWRLGLEVRTEGDSEM